MWEIYKHGSGRGFITTKGKLEVMKSTKQMVILVLGVLVSAHEAFSCSPPKNLLVVQLPELSNIAQAPEVREKVLSLGGEDIQSIQYEKRVYTITSSNGCSFEAKAKYIPSPHSGMCPSWGGLELSEGKCN